MLDFRYKLVNVDRGWQAAGNSKEVGQPPRGDRVWSPRGIVPLKYPREQATGNSQAPVAAGNSKDAGTCKDAGMCTVRERRWELSLEEKMLHDLRFCRTGCRPEARYPRRLSHGS